MSYDENDRIKMLKILCIIAMVSIGIFGYIDYQSAPQIPIYETWYMGLIALLCYSFVVFFPKKVSYKFIGELLGTTGLIGMVHKCILGEGQNAYSVYWLFTIPCLLFAISSRKVAFLSALLAIGSYIGLMYYHPVEVLRPSASWTYPLSFGTALLVCIIILLKYDKDSKILMAQLKSRHKELEASVRELDAAGMIINDQLEENQQLIRLMSHDIKNPLSVVRGALGLIENFSDDVKFKKAIDKINTSSLQIDNIVTNISDIQAVRGGKTELALEPLNLEITFSELQKMFEDKVKNKDIDLSFSVSDVHLNVLADKVSLTHQVLANLISNAIKFTPTGKKIRVSAQSWSENKILIVVKDEGIGMPLDLVDNVFSSHIKTSRKGTNGEKGTGFGMPLVKAFVEKMQGQIEIISKEATESESENSGTQVSIVLNRASKNSAEIKPAA
ncbi:MAG: sensor histidine kinase [Pseudobdellovibrionaceae bacterium]